MTDQITSVVINTFIILFLFGFWVSSIWYVYKDTTRRHTEGDLTPLKQVIWTFFSFFPVVGPLAYLFWRHRTANHIANWLPKPDRTNADVYEAKTNLPGGGNAYNGEEEPVTSLWSNTVDDTIIHRTDRVTQIPEDIRPIGLNVEVLDGPGRLATSAGLQPGKNIIGAVPPQTGHFIMVDDDNAISGQHLLVEVNSLSSDMWITNLSQYSRTEVNSRQLTTKERVKIGAPATLKLGYTTVTIANGEASPTYTASQTSPPVYSDEYNSFSTSQKSKYGLRVRRGANFGHLFPITSSPFVVGRDKQICNLTLTNDPTVSRKHASLKQNGATLCIENESDYGTLVNDIRIQEKWLSAGDEIQIGETILVVEVTK